MYRVLLGNPEGRRPLGRPRHRWVDNIRMGLQEVGCGYVDWIGLAQDKDRWRTLVSVVMNLRVPWNAGNFLTSCKPVTFLRILCYRHSRISSSHILHCPPQNDAVPKRQFPWLCSTLIQSVTNVCGLEFEYILNPFFCISFLTFL